MTGSPLEKTDGFIKGIQYIALGIAGAIVAVFVLTFIALTTWRLIGLLWRSVFGHPWGI